VAKDTRNLSSCIELRDELSVVTPTGILPPVFLNSFEYCDLATIQEIRGPRGFVLKLVSDHPVRTCRRGRIISKSSASPVPIPIAPDSQPSAEGRGNALDDGLAGPLEAGGSLPMTELRRQRLGTARTLLVVEEDCMVQLSNSPRSGLQSRCVGCGAGYHPACNRTMIRGSERSVL
jgi:hypothetical protein